MPRIPEVLSVAIQHHQAGRLDAAEQIYRQILAVQPDHADALHLLGVIASQQGQYHTAADYISRAIQIDAQEPGYHLNLANALAALARNDDAIAAYQKAVELKPDFAEAYCNLGNAYRSQGQLSQAVAAYRRAIELKPSLAQAHSNLGAILKSQGDFDEALSCLRQAVQLMPNLAEAHNNLGFLLEELGQLGDAIVCYRRALDTKPDFPAALNNLGHALKEQDNIDEAAQCFELAVAAAPNYAEALSNLGAAYKAQGKLDAAVACYERAIALRPDLVEVHCNFGNALHALGRLDEAAESYRRALALIPDYAEAHFSQAFLMLQRGDFEHGWPEYEWRWRTKEYKPLALHGRNWNGEPVKTVLLHTDQGLGDTLQFIRFTPWVKQRADKVLLRGPARLIPLLKSCPGIDELILPDIQPPDFDAEAYLTSLPGPLNITLENLPRSVPYLSANTHLVEEWRSKLPGGYRVGISWQGNPKYKGDRTRSIPLAEFAALAEIRGVTLISLQKGFGEEQLAAARNQSRIHELGPGIDEQHGAFMDTAAVMMNLDLVITSDTSIAHLAGALGVQVWVALSFMPEWRWLLDRSDSPWYPTMRLFRQKRAGDWAAVFEEIRRALMKRLDD